MSVKTRKKLIEVALPLEAINVASAREKSIRHGHPSTLHLWWARRPLAAARAVIFAQMVDDPSSHPEKFPTEEAQDKERKRLFDLIEKLVQWENTTNEGLLEKARAEIRKSWRVTCEDNKDHPRAAELFNPDKLPAFHDPFAGGGALPLEAQRLGLEAYASDLNPVAVLINKAMIEIPPKFAGRAPINPDAQNDRDLIERDWKGAAGLAEDVRYYGQWMRDEAEKRIGHLYPKIEITKEMAKERPDLKTLVGRELTVIAWIWARTVKSPNPAFREVDVPLASTFMLSTKKGKEAYVEPVVEGDDYRFAVRVGRPKDPDAAKNGTKLSRGANFQCILSGTPIAAEYVKSEGKAGRMGSRLMAVVAEGNRRRVYLPPAPEHETTAREAKPTWKPTTQLPQKALGFSVQLYFHNGTYGDLFTDRQLVALTTYSELTEEVRERVFRDAFQLRSGGSKPVRAQSDAEARAYADSVALYLALAVDKASDYDSALVMWSPSRDQVKTTFARNAMPMIWDYGEVNVFAGAAGDIAVSLKGISRVIERLGSPTTPGYACQADAQSQTISSNKVVSTDPPYFDNIGYADLSDFFYAWLRPSLKTIFPSLFSTVAVPKAEELVATPDRHGGKIKAERFFLSGMASAMQRMSKQGHPCFPVSVYYAFRQSETDTDEGTSSTGWEVFLDAATSAGFSITGTWPIRTEREVRSRGIKSNALASSIVLVCRARESTASMATRGQFLAVLKKGLPPALKKLQHGNIAPVDLAQASIGPGMAIFSAYSKVVEADGTPMRVRTALALINQVLDEYLAEQEGEFDADTRWALAWFQQSGMEAGPYGVAETLSTAMNTSVQGMVEAGFLYAKGGKVRLLRRDELDAKWNPSTDNRLTVWEVTQHLIHALSDEGDEGAAALARRLGDMGEIARDLSYRLYNICERKGWAQEAIAYNSLVVAWPEITKLAATAPLTAGQQTEIEG